MVRDDSFCIEFGFLFFFHRGLIAPSIAARMLGVTKGRITQLMTSGKLEKIVVQVGSEELVFLSFLEVLEYANSRCKNGHR